MMSAQERQPCLPMLPPPTCRARARRRCCRWWRPAASWWRPDARAAGRRRAAPPRPQHCPCTAGSGRARGGSPATCKEEQRCIVILIYTIRSFMPSFGRRRLQSGWLTSHLHGTAVQAYQSSHVAGQLRVRQHQMIADFAENGMATSPACQRSRPASSMILSSDCPCMAGSGRARGRSPTTCNQQQCTLICTVRSSCPASGKLRLQARSAHLPPARVAVQALTSVVQQDDPKICDLLQGQITSAAAHQPLAEQAEVAHLPLTRNRCATSARLPGLKWLTNTCKHTALHINLNAGINMPSSGKGFSRKQGGARPISPSATGQRCVPIT